VSDLGTPENPLRVAVIGAGPSGFYAAEHLLKQKDKTIYVDMFDRLPTPFGLVRGGVAPDHQKIKSVTKVYDRIAAKDEFRFFGYVEFGTDITLDDLKTYYHQAIFTTGAQTDKKLDIPNIDHPNSRAATEFVAWYNGHPDYRDYTFDLSQEKVAVIGVGNVAVDVARILSRSADELAKTDIADYALEQLAESKVKEVYLLGRRGPAQAAFTTPEIRELGELEDADCIVLPDEGKLDALSQEDLDASTDRALKKKVDIIQSYATGDMGSKSKKLYVRFLVSPTELIVEDGALKGMTLVHNELYRTERGGVRPRATDKTERLDCGLVFRSIGYRGVPLAGIPFREDWGVINNDQGRITDVDSQDQVVGLYTAGWIKRGPSGVIGTNKPDSVETVNLMLEDATAGVTWEPSQPDRDALREFVSSKKPNYVSYDDWLKLDALEVERGEALGRPRLKFTVINDMLDVLK